MFHLYDSDMKRKDLPLGVRPLDIVVSSIGKEPWTETIENVPGVIRYGSRDTTRRIELKFYLQADSSADFRRLRNELFDCLDGMMYVVESAFGERRYLIELAETFTPTRYDMNQTSGELTVNADTANLPYAESIEPMKINGRIFFVDGNQPIEPFRQHLKFEIKNIKGSTDYFELRNKANETYFRVNEPIAETDDIVVDGVTVSINGGQALRKTDKTFIVLEPGKNELELSGATDADITVAFRNYYK